MSDSVTKRERARIDLDRIQAAYNGGLPTIVRSHSMREGWTLQSRCRESRLDAAFHDPVVSQVAADLVACGGTACRDLADAHIPGRYVRYYVSPDFGRPIVSGAQLLQSRLVNLRYISDRSFRRPADYILQAGIVAFQAEGRAEEGIALPVLITAGRDGWFANNHVMRLKPRWGVVPGALFLAVNSPHAQLQIKARSTGSVVDAVSVSDLGSVVLPPLDDKLGLAAEEAWKLLDQADADEAEAIADLEAAVESITGEVQIAV